MGQNVIELGFNVEELSAQKKQVLDLFVDMFGQLAKYDGTRFNPLGEGGLADLKKSLTDGAAAMAAFGEKAKQYNDIITQQYQKQQQAKSSTSDLSLAMQAHQKIVDQLAQTQAKNNAAGSDAAEGLALERAALTERNKELATSAKLQLAESGSTGEAKIIVAQLTAEREKLNLTTEEGKARQAELNEEINKQNAFIKENVSLQEQQKINIGNYASSLAPAFDAQRERLEQINKQLAEMELRGKGVQNLGGQPIGFSNDRFKGGSNITGQSAGGVANFAGGAGQNVSILNEDAAAYQKITLEGKILEGSLNRQAIGFKTVNQEMRGLKNTLDALELAGLENSEAFEKGNIAYTTAEQKVKDLHREQAILTTDAPGITALTGVARGLGGAYAFGAGASQLLASGNEKLDKELNKLVAVMTLLQGLQEAVSVLKEKNAIATALEAEATKALNFVKGIEAAIFGPTTAAISTETAAKTVNTEAQVANTEGLEANAAGAIVNAEAMDGVVIATEGATSATVGFETALVATGIGAIIIGLIYGITKLVGAISDWATADERTEETQKALTETMSKQIEITKQLQDISQYYSKERIDNLTKEAALQQSAGANQFIQLANERQINEARLEMAQKVIDARKIDQASVDMANQKKKDATEIQQGLITLLGYAQRANNIANNSATKEFLENTQKKVDEGDKETKNVIADYNIQFSALKELSDSKHAIADNDVKTAKAAADQLAKITADSHQRQFETTQAHNEHILGSATSSQDDRLGAIQGNYQAEADLGNSQIAALKKQMDAKTITEQEGADQIATIQNNLTIKYQKSLDDQLKIRVEFNDRLLDAENALYKNDNGSDAAKQDAITKDTQRQLEVRLQSLQQYINDRTAIINNDYRTELAKAKEKNTTDAEYAAMDSNRQKQLVELTDNVQKQIYDIAVSWGERRIKAIEEQNKATNSANAVTANYNAEEQQLNNHLAKNILYFLGYAGNKKKLDEQYAVDKTAADVKDDQAELARLKDFQKNEVQVKLDAANADMGVAKEGGNIDEIAQAQSKVDALTKIQTEGAANIADITKKLGDDTIKNQNAVANLTLKKAQDSISTIREFSLAAAQTMVGLFDDAKDRQIQSLELVTARQDAAVDATIAGVQRGTDTQRQQQEEVAILTQHKAATDASAKKKEAEDKRTEAKLDQDLAVANVIWNTEAAVAKTFAEYGFTPIGFALAAVGAALGAVQVATILSKPIPAYAEGIGIAGKGQHPGGTALVGEEGLEIITEPGKKPFLVDQPTFINLAPNSSVQPLTDSVADLASISMLRGFAILNAHAPQDNNVERAINNQTNRLERALKKSQKNITNVIKINVDPFANPNDSITRKLRGTKR